MFPSKKRKQYLYDKNQPLNKYAISIAKKNMEQEELQKKDHDQVHSERRCKEKPNVNYEDLFHTSYHAKSFGISMNETDEELRRSGNEIKDSIYDSTYKDIDSSDEELANYLNIMENTDNSQSINELIHDDKFFEVISLKVKRSPAELLLMILKYSISDFVCMTSITKLLKLVNAMFDRSVLPETRYKIDKLCSPVNNVTLHGICTRCSKYIGIFQDFSGSVSCENCNMEVDMSNPSDKCYFALIDPSDALRAHLEANEQFYDYVVKERAHETDHISDIYDGVMYRNFLKSLTDDDRGAYATVVFNTDGAAVFKSSSYSVWPIYIIPNEIPIQTRLNSSITVGLWFGMNKPDMSVFLDVFVPAMNHLSTVGIPCTIKNKKYCIKIFALLACVDTPARCSMNGTSQFNGYYGCDWCLHKGKFYDGSMRYPFEYPFPQARDHATAIIHAAQATDSNTRVFGVKTASPLLDLKNFDIIRGFVPDYMHFYVAGVVKQYTEYLLRYVTQTDICHIDDLLEQIRSPTQIERLSRPFKHRKYWKAREYENWVLYYSIPVLSSVLKNERILRHWSLLVDALHICLQTDITYTDLNRANEMLHKFLADAEDMYSLAALSYNAHQLQHVVESIYNWGPLYTHSTYPFESANHELLKAIHSSKGVILQIVRYENIQRTIQILEKSLKNASYNKVTEYCDNLKGTSIKNAFKLSTITYLSKDKPVDNNLAERFGISKRAKVFYKIVYEGSVFMTSRKENKRSCNYFAQLSNGVFVKLLDFVVEFENNRELTVCQIIETKSNKYSTIVKEVLRFSDEICIASNQIAKTCIFIQTETEAYIIPLPNQLFY